MCDVGRKRDLLDWDGLGGRGFLGSIDIAARRCHCRFDAEASFFEADRRRIGSEQMSGKLGRLLFEFLHRVVDGCSADGGAAAAKRADAVLHDRRVSVNDGDVIYIDTELICYELSERCFLALSVWRRSGKHGYLSCGFNSHGRAFPSAGGGRLRRTDRADFYVSRNTDAYDTSLLASLLLLVAHRLVVGHRKSLVERALIIAAVIEQTGCGLERELGGLRKVLAAYLYRVHPKFGRDKVRGSFNNLCCFGSPCASIGIGRHLVREYRGHVHLDRRNLVTA